jgi:hypothetical protein
MNTHYISIKHRFIGFMVVVVFLLPACRPKTVPFTVVREADFRVGPVDLPLNDEGKKKLTDFLLKGGDNCRGDIAAPDAPKAYAALFVLLSDDTFLHRSKFRKEGAIGEISKPLGQWFEKSIVYSLIDSQNKRPLVIAPLSLADKNGKYRWVFYMPQPPGNFEKDPRIIQVLVTLTPTKDIVKY